MSGNTTTPANAGKKTSALFILDQSDVVVALRSSDPECIGFAAVSQKLKRILQGLKGIYGPEQTRIMMVTCGTSLKSYEAEPYEDFDGALAVNIGEEYFRDKEALKSFVKKQNPRVIALDDECRAGGKIEKSSGHLGTASTGTVVFIGENQIEMEPEAFVAYVRQQLESPTPAQ